MADAIEKYLVIPHSHLQYCLFIQLIQVIHILKCGWGCGPSPLTGDLLEGGATSLAPEDGQPEKLGWRSHWVLTAFSLPFPWTLFWMGALFSGKPPSKPLVTMLGFSPQHWILNDSLLTGRSAIDEENGNKLNSSLFNLKTEICF